MGKRKAPERIGDGERVRGRDLDMLTLEHEVAQAQERIAELEFGLEDRGWDRIDSQDSSLDLDRRALRNVIRDAQAMYLANPLINHAVNVVADYVFGQPPGISGVGAANDRVQEFIGHPANRRALFSQQALLGNDRALTYEGNRFIALVSPREPREVVQVRVLPTLEFVDGDVIRDPEDAGTIWYYMRRWTPRGSQQRVDYYPSLDWLLETDTDDATEAAAEAREAARPAEYGTGGDKGPVHWDQPVVHMMDGGLHGSKFGVPTILPALSWARAVSRDMSDYATIRRALARFAWKITTKRQSTARSVQTRLRTTVTSDAPIERNPPPTTGSAFIATEGNDIAPLKTAGAAPSPEEGRRLWNMVAAGTGIPETILAGNADTGNLATAKTLDRPTELKMASRQGQWADALQAVIGYDLARAAKGRVIPAEEPDPDGEDAVDPETGVAYQAMRPVELTPDIDFTDVLEQDVTARIDSIVKAATLGANGTRAETMPDELLTRLLLSALGVDDIDEVTREMYREQPEDQRQDDQGDLLPGLPGDPTAGAGTPAMAPEARLRHALGAFGEALAGGGGAGGRRGRGKPRTAPPEADH